MNYCSQIATIKSFTRHLFPARYVVFFETNDGKIYRKSISCNEHWKKIFFAMGQNKLDFFKIEDLVGNKVELIIDNEYCRYVNRICTQI